MTWEIEFLPEADRDMDELDGSVKARSLKASRKSAKIPCRSRRAATGSLSEIKAAQTSPAS